VGIVFPYELPAMNYLEILNEYTILSSCYFLFLYSDGLVLTRHPNWPLEDVMISDELVREQLGWANTGLIGFLFLANLLFMTVSSVAKLKRKFRLWQLKRK